MKARLWFMTFLAMSLQQLNAQMKTVELEEVTIESMPFEKYISGSKMEKSDSLEMASLNNRTLADYLTQNSTVYIKEQGNAMLASISFRGTGSSHTGVFWHGININSLTLGSTDFNGVPMFLFDGIGIQYGGASSLHGSDAIGGSVHLESKPLWTKGSKLQVRQDFGSFGHYFTGVKLHFGNGKWESKTRFFNRNLKNNFTYKINDRLGDSYDVEQENASVHNYGVLQELNGKLSKSGYLSLKGWYADNYHQIQPLMVSYPGQEQEGDEILNRNFRLIAAYDHFFESGTLSSTIGYVWDYQLFNKSDLIETNRAIANLDYEWNLNNTTTIKAGGSGMYIVPNVWSYEGDLEEWRGDIFLSLKQKLISNWVMNINARKTFVPFTDSPVAPSLSTSYTIGHHKTIMVIRGQVERSYRVPTFNDRYWGDQGRKDLKAENGYSMDLGYKIKHLMKDSKLEFDIDGFYMKVDDWIAWKPDGNIWRPYNLKQVESSGIEFQVKYHQQFNQVDFQIGGMYAYNRAILLKGITENDPAIGYQLPYTPIHRYVFFLDILCKDFRLTVNNNFTGERNGINVINEKVEGFVLTDLHLSKNISIGKQLLTLEGQVLNLFDVDYQNVKRYAMPGRNYLLSINFFINN